MAKVKCWYKNIKAGDVIKVKLLPGHSWYEDNKDKTLIATVDQVYSDGTMATICEKSLSSVIENYNLLLGWNGTNWEQSYPANIIKKLSKA